MTNKRYDDVVNNKGDNGERLIADVLDRTTGFGRTLVNLYLPTEYGTTEIDVVRIHRTGIYVFESKNYSGTIEGMEHQDQWTQHLEGGRKLNFYNPIKQNAGHIKALRAALPDVDPDLFASVIVFSKRCTLKTKTHTLVLNRDDLYKRMEKEIRETWRRVSIDDIEKIYNHLLQYANADEDIKKKHVENIKRRK